jgi:hypothetical protein
MPFSVFTKSEQEAKNFELMCCKKFRLCKNPNFSLRYDAIESCGMADVLRMIGPGHHSHYHVLHMIAVPQ